MCRHCAILYFRCFILRNAKIMQLFLKIGWIFSGNLLLIFLRIYEFFGKITEIVDKMIKRGNMCMRERNGGYFESLNVCIKVSH